MGKRKYSDEFKERAIQMALESGKTVQEVADSLGIGAWSLRQWKKDYLRSNREILRSQGKLSAEEELIILRKQLAEVKMENTILKKFAAILSKDQ